MSRLKHVVPTEAQGEAKELLDQVQSQVGTVPNFMRVFANSPATLAGFLALNGSLARGALDSKTRERIALTMAEGNGCQYCVSAHTVLGQQAGLDEAEIHAARRGGSADPKADAALKFAQAVLENRGDVTTAEFNAVREAGHDDEQIVEIIANVALGVFTNYFAKANQIDIDFPEVALLGRTAA